MSATRRAGAHVHLSAIARNCTTLRGLLGPDTRLCAVVKADAYGHGAVEVAEAAQRGGASWLAVASALEAIDLRNADVEGRILVMGALTAFELEMAVAAEADVVAWTREFAEAAPRVHVKFDSGMGRLGTKDVELVHELAGLPQTVGLMTHFATADEPGDDHFPRQLEAFSAVAEQHPQLLLHAANSAATFRDPASHFGMVRCGIAVYGMDPFQGDPAERGLEPALELRSWVAAVRRFEPGDSAGYGRRWRARESTWVGTIPIGYGDGWRRALTNDCDVLIGGRRHPLVGTVSMDNVTVDLGADTDVQVGDEVTLIGAQGGERILAEEVARRLDTINYEVTCGLSPRVSRYHLQ